jgi:hypothetical protein
LKIEASAVEWRSLIPRPLKQILMSKIPDVIVIGAGAAGLN